MGQLAGKVKCVCICHNWDTSQHAVARNFMQWMWGFKNQTTVILWKQPGSLFEGLGHTPDNASCGVSLSPFVYLLLAVLAVKYQSEMHTTPYIWWEESSASVECILYCIHILFYPWAQLCCKGLQNVKPSVQQKHRREKLAYNLLGCDTSQKKPKLNLTTPGTGEKSTIAWVKRRSTNLNFILGAFAGWGCKW